MGSVSTRKWKKQIWLRKQRFCKQTRGYPRKGKQLGTPWIWSSGHSVHLSAKTESETKIIGPIRS